MKEVIHRTSQIINERKSVSKRTTVQPLKGNLNHSIHKIQGSLYLWCCFFINSFLSMVLQIGTTFLVISLPKLANYVLLGFLK